MKRPLFLLLLVLLANPSAADAQSEQQKQTIAVLNRADVRLMKGDITALDDVKALPGDDAVAGLLMFFKQYFYVYSTETEKKAIAAKAAQYITESPTAGPYIKRLFKKEANRPPSGNLTKYRQVTLESLITARNAFAVRTLFELMDESELEVPVGDFTRALARMSLPDAPFPAPDLRSTKNPNYTPEGIAKWKEWWEANKANY